MFDKFMNDLEKRIDNNNNKKKSSDDSITEDKAKRLRELRYKELWQNRIEWSNNNG